MGRYDIITAKEKQATRSGICFSAVVNEQTSDEIGHKALEARVCEFHDIIFFKALQCYGIWEYIDEQTFFFYKW
ncbi:MAG: hypothetical protein K2H40_00740 [Lachnospiraceae bacterium]|nr:hypothetical protein [Lachnospiraceae bacterium]